MRGVAEDMALWEAGDLPLAEVTARHPEAGVHELAELHVQLSALLQEDPSLETAGVWVEIRGRLQSPGSPFRLRLRRRWARQLVAAAAALFLIGGIAYASGVEPVRGGVDRVVRVVKGMFGDDREDTKAPAKAPRTGERPGSRDSSGPGQDGDDRADGDDRSGPNRGPDEDDRDEDRSGPSGGNDDGEHDREEAEHDEPDDDDDSSSSGSGSGSDEEPDEEPDDSEGPDEHED